MQAPKIFSYIRRFFNQSMTYVKSQMSFRNEVVCCDGSHTSFQNTIDGQLKPPINKQ